LICLDHHTTGDGTIAALQVLAAMSQQRQSMAQLLEGVTLYPQVLINVKLKTGYDWKSDVELMKQISQAEDSILGVGRVLIRASGTEPLLRIMVETQDSDTALSVAKSIAELLPSP
jgi:phosphoglucosamine mutase